MWYNGFGFFCHLVAKFSAQKVSFGRKNLIWNFRFFVSQFENVKIAQTVVETFQFFRAIEILNGQNKTNQPFYGKKSKFNTISIP